jgi:hypothetical protein
MAEMITARHPKKLGLLTLPGMVVSLLPTLACPLLWPTYTALLSALGLSFLGSATYLLPLTGALLVVAVVGLGLQSKTAGYGPVLLGLVAVAAILPGKFVMGSNLATYGGGALLAIASAWSLVSKRSAAAAAGGVHRLLSVTGMTYSVLGQGRAWVDGRFRRQHSHSQSPVGTGPGDRRPTGHADPARERGAESGFPR